MRATGTGHIDDGRTVVLRQQCPQPLIFVLVGVGVDYGIVKVGACGFRGIQFQVEPQRLLEVVADVLYHLLLGRSREARHGNRLSAAFHFLVFANELADVEIVNAEVLPPRRETVGLVDDETHHVAGQQNLLNSF